MRTNFSNATKSLTLTELDNLQSYKPIGQELAKIQASDPEANDYFGVSVAVSDTRIVVGAEAEDTTASNAGAAYIFDINGNQIAKIQASDPEANDWFGYSVAVSDTRIVVGAWGEDTTASDAGSAYIFDINGNQLAKIQASDPESGDRFSLSVAVSNTRVVVGSPYEGTTANFAGSAYIFDIDGTQLAKIQASDAGVDDNFGYSVAVSDTRIVIGAYKEDAGSAFITDAGSAYIFDIDGNQLAKIQASDFEASDQFGRSVAVSNNRIVVGAPYEGTTASFAGSAYIFDINGNQIAKIQASDPVANAYFGYSVAVSDNRIVIGAYNTEATYIFDINGNQLAKIQASDTEGGDQFGRSVAVSDTRIVVGARYERTTAALAGSAYIFTAGFSPFGDLCAYYDLGDPTALDTNFSWSNYT